MEDKIQLLSRAEFYNWVYPLLRDQTNKGKQEIVIREGQKRTDDHRLLMKLIVQLEQDDLVSSEAVLPNIYDPDERPMTVYHFKSVLLDIISMSSDKNSFVSLYKKYLKDELIKQKIIKKIKIRKNIFKNLKLFMKYCIDPKNLLIIILIVIIIIGIISPELREFFSNIIGIFR